MKHYYLYVIQSNNGRRYIGITENIKKRLAQHNAGFSNWTSRYKNWKLIYKEKLDNLTQARKRENYFKKLKGGETFKKILEKVS